MTLPSSDAPETAAHVGRLLRQAREEQDRTLHDVAQELNLTRQRLEQLEAGEFDKLPGNTFARGYLRAYAKVLGLDPQAIVAAFDAHVGQGEVASEVKSIGRINEPLRVSQTILRALSFLVLLILGAVGYFWWQERSLPSLNAQVEAPQHIEVESADGTTQLHPLTELEDDAVAESQVTEPVEPAQVVPEGEAAAQTTADAAVAPAEGAADSASAAPVAAEAAAVTAPVAPEAAGAATVATPVTPTAVEAAPAPVAAAAEQPPVAEGEGVVNISFSDTCWVQLKDANKRVLHSSIKRAGEQLRVVGKLPIEVHLGVAKAAAITFNGNQVDMSPYSSGETARFKLGQ